MTLSNNLKLAENAVLSVEESLSKVFQERSNQVFQKLENILTIFREEKGSTSHFNQSSGCLLYTSPSPRDAHESRMPSSA